MYVSIVIPALDLLPSFRSYVSRSSCHAADNIRHLGLVRSKIISLNATAGVQTDIRWGKYSYLPIVCSSTDRSYEIQEDSNVKVLQTTHNPI